MTTSEQQPPVNNGPPKPSQANKIAIIPPLEHPSMYNRHFYGVPSMFIVDGFECTAIKKIHLMVKVRLTSKQFYLNFTKKLLFYFQHDLIKWKLF
jgi:hypothetical protein